MQTEEAPVDQVLNLRVGEIVEVRSEAEILATLDGRGELESLPFMPEMLQFCGRRFRVDKLAVKLCDTIGSTGMYRMRNAVHLEGVRCDGQAHGGCQAGCLIYWKEAWLRRVPADGRSRPARRRACAAAHARDADGGDPQGPGRRLRGRGAVLVPGDRAAPGGARAHPGLGRQAVRAGRPVGQRQPARHDPRRRHRGVQRVPGLQPEVRCRGRCGSGAAHGCPSSTGSSQKTPDGTLDLQPGELVRIKSKEEIVGTLDGNNSNRGLSFDPEMLWYCGQEARVLRRVERIAAVQPRRGPQPLLFHRLRIR